jgi:hypothetical protein
MMKCIDGIMLTKDDCDLVRIMLQDPVTDAVLAQSEANPSDRS